MKKMLVMAAMAAFIAVPAHANDAKMDSKTDYFFSQVDTNADGKISKDEHSAFGDKMFTEADTNNDGYLTKDELKAAKKKEMENAKAAK